MADKIWLVFERHWDCETLDDEDILQNEHAFFDKDEACRYAKLRNQQIAPLNEPDFSKSYVTILPVPVAKSADVVIKKIEAREKVWADADLRARQKPCMMCRTIIDSHKARVVKNLHFYQPNEFEPVRRYVCWPCHKTCEPADIRAQYAKEMDAAQAAIEADKA